MAIHILRGPETTARTGESRSTRYQRIREGLFPRPVRIGPRAVGWPDYEIDALIASRIAGATDDELRELVVQLEGARKTAFSGGAAR